MLTPPVLAYPVATTEWHDSAWAAILALSGVGVLVLWVLGQVRGGRRRAWATEVACAVRARDLRALGELAERPYIRNWGHGIGDALAEIAVLVEREQASGQRLARRDNLQRSRLELMPVPALVVGEEDRITGVSDEACWLFSCKRKAFIGSRLDELFERVEPVPRRHLRLLDSLGGSADKLLLRTRTGDAVPFGIQDSLTLLVFARTVEATAGLEPERVLTLLDISAFGLEPDRMTPSSESIERFAGEVAREFNDRLTAILGHAAELEERGADEPTRTAGHRIVEEVSHARGMTSQLLAFSRRRVRMPHATDLGTSLGDCRAAFERVLGHDVALDLRLPEEEFLIPVTESRMRSVVEHVLRDLLEDLESGGSVRIDVLGEDAQGVGSPGVRLRLSASIGHRQRRGERPHLESAREVLAGAQGRLVVQSAPSAGREVISVVWPRVSQRVADGGPEGTPARVEGSGPATVCVVDDDDGVRNVIAETLRRSGYHVLTASSGMAAMELFRESEAPIDLLVVDLGMRPMSGSDLVSALTSRHGRVNALYMSGSVDHEVFRSGMARPEDFLQKPFRPREIVDHVERALGRIRSLPRILYLDPCEEDLITSLLGEFSIPPARAYTGAQALEWFERERAQVLLMNSAHLSVRDLEAVRELRRRWPALTVLDLHELEGRDDAAESTEGLEDALERALREVGLLGVGTSEGQRLRSDRRPAGSA